VHGCRSTGTPPTSSQRSSPAPPANPKNLAFGRSASGAPRRRRCACLQRCSPQQARQARNRGERAAEPALGGMSHLVMPARYGAGCRGGLAVTLTADSAQSASSACREGHPPWHSVEAGELVVIDSAHPPAQGACQARHKLPKGTSAGLGQCPVSMPSGVQLGHSTDPIIAASHYHGDRHRHNPLHPWIRSERGTT
jgi:hypothetical protein